MRGKEYTGLQKNQPPRKGGCFLRRAPDGHIAHPQFAGDTLLSLLMKNGLFTVYLMDFMLLRNYPGLISIKVNLKLWASTLRMIFFSILQEQTSMAVKLVGGQTPTSVSLSMLNLKHTFFWDPMVEKIQIRLNGWINFHISKGRRHTLL